MGRKQRKMKNTRIEVATVSLLSTMLPAMLLAARYPAPQEATFTLRDFRFRSGESLEVRMHYLTLGNPERDSSGVVRNAVLILHGTTGSSAQFLRPEFAEELYGSGQPLDVSRYYVIIPDNIGHGKSTKPSDGLRARFPKYGYVDMVEAQHRLLTEGLGVNHLRLIIGTSMGGMQTWLWGEAHPDFMDALMPLGCLSTQISGRNRAWRRVVIDAIRNDPEWEGGNYRSQPRGLRTALQLSYLMSSNSQRRLKEAPTLPAADQALDRYVAEKLADTDANDMLYAFEASRDYDPGPNLEKIVAPLLAINSADDLINPPELGILEREIKRVPRGRAVVIPLSKHTQGHGSHTIAALWKAHLIELLEQSAAESLSGQEKSGGK
jgi:homoserine O-acetyltransferase